MSIAVGDDDDGDLRMDVVVVDSGKLARVVG